MTWNDGSLGCPQPGRCTPRRSCRDTVSSPDRGRADCSTTPTIARRDRLRAAVADRPEGPPAPATGAGPAIAQPRTPPQDARSLSGEPQASGRRRARRRARSRAWRCRMSFEVAEFPSLSPMRCVARVSRRVTAIPAHEEIATRHRPVPLLPAALRARSRPPAAVHLPAAGRRLEPHGARPRVHPRRSLRRLLRARAFRTGCAVCRSRSKRARRAAASSELTTDPDVTAETQIERVVRDCSRSGCTCACRRRLLHRSRRTPGTVDASTLPVKRPAVSRGGPPKIVSRRLSAFAHQGARGRISASDACVAPPVLVALGAFVKISRPSCGVVFGTSPYCLGRRVVASVVGASRGHRRR